MAPTRHVWKLLYKHNTSVPENFIERFVKHADWAAISKRGNLSLNFIAKYCYKLYWKSLCRYQSNLTENFLLTYIGFVMCQDLWTNSNVPLSVRQTITNILLENYIICNFDVELLCKICFSNNSHIVKTVCCNQFFCKHYLNNLIYDEKDCSICSHKFVQIDKISTLSDLEYSSDSGNEKYISL
jgi:hypothetical protein